MPETYIEDEFDILPDPFEGFDFDTIPALAVYPSEQPSAAPVITTSTSNALPSAPAAFTDDNDEENFEDFDDPFAEVDWSTVPDFGDEKTSTTSQPVETVPQTAQATVPEVRVDNIDSIPASLPPSRPGSSSRASTQYSFDEVDEAFLQEVDVIESDALERGTSSCV